MVGIYIEFGWNQLFSKVFILRILSGVRNPLRKNLLCKYFKKAHLKNISNPFLCRRRLKRRHKDLLEVEAVLFREVCASVCVCVCLLQGVRSQAHANIISVCPNPPRHKSPTNHVKKIAQNYKSRRPCDGKNPGCEWWCQEGSKGKGRIKNKEERGSKQSSFFEFRPPGNVLKSDDALLLFEILRLMSIVIVDRLDLIITMKHEDLILNVFYFHQARRCVVSSNTELFWKF